MIFNLFRISVSHEWSVKAIKMKRFSSARLSATGGACVYTSIKIKFTCVWVHRYPLAHTHVYKYFLFSNVFIILLLATFLCKNEQKSATNHGCTLDSLMSKRCFGSSFLLKSPKITPPIFLWNHILPFHRWEQKYQLHVYPVRHF